MDTGLREGARPPPGFSHAEWISDNKGNAAQRAEICGHICLNSYLDITPFVPDESVGKGKALVLCGGGPSLADHVEDIRALQKSGARVVCINDSHVFLKEQGIDPFCWAYGEVQYLPPDHRWFRDHSDTPLYLASHCNTEVVKLLRDERTVMWHWHAFDLANTCIGTFFPGQVAFGGSAVPLLRFMSVCVVGWGYRRVHLFGADSSYREGRSHAYEAYTPTASAVPMWCHGREFLSTPHLVRQARDFCEIMDVHAERKTGLVVTVYGDGLLPWLARSREAA